MVNSLGGSASVALELHRSPKHREKCRCKERSNSDEHAISDASEIIMNRREQRPFSLHHVAENGLRHEYMPLCEFHRKPLQVGRRLSAIEKNGRRPEFTGGTPKHSS